jgi:D-sedoheptulose 7-phosphate isomerase
MPQEDFRKKFVKGYVKETKDILDLIEDELVEKLDRISNILIKARDDKKTVFIMGNGGSGSTASHFACDLQKLTIVDGSKRFKAIALTDNIPTILAWANDKSYDDIFVEQLKNLMDPNDIVIGISGSGNSMNVIKAIEYANENGGITIGFSGFDGGKLLKIARENIHAAADMQKAEDLHLIIMHILTSMIREEEKINDSR